MVRHDLISYYTAIERMDGETAAILKLLETEGLVGNTIVFFVSDNGMPFPGAKATLYDAGVRVPLIVRWPGHVPAASVQRSNVSLLDLAPTWLELTGADPLPRMEGRSLVPALKGGTLTERPALFERNCHDTFDPIRGVRFGRYLMIRNYRPEMRYTPSNDLGISPSWKAILDLHKDKKLPSALEQRYFHTPRPNVELYDVDSDPYQLRNLATEAEQSSTIQQGNEFLDKWMIETNDFLPPPIQPNKGNFGEAAEQP